MLPARYFGSGRSGRHPAIRNILTATVAALVGTIIGGLSVLGVVLAVVEPPNHDIRADARDDSTTTGSSQPVVAAAPRPAPADPSANAPALPPAAASSPPPAATTPPAIQAQADSPAPPPQPQTAAPQEQAAAPGPAPTPQTAWPDALTRRTLQDHAQDHANGSDTPQQSSTAQNGSPAATGNDQESFDKKDVRDAQKPPAPANRSVASRDGITTRLSNTDQAG
jgi:type IV secretory pathway VirB10-like protein